MAVSQDGKAITHLIDRRYSLDEVITTSVSARLEMLLLLRKFTFKVLRWADLYQGVPDFSLSSMALPIMRMRNVLNTVQFGT